MSSEMTIHTADYRQWLGDLKTRFRPFLVRISVQADADPECTIVLRLARFDLQELPAVVTIFQTKTGEKALSQY